MDDTTRHRKPKERGGRRKGYAIRAREGSARSRNPVHELTVPTAIADRVPEGTLFVPELTEEGILYRRREAPPEPPSWLEKA